MLLSTNDPVEGLVRLDSKLAIALSKSVVAFLVVSFSMVLASAKNLGEYSGLFLLFES